MEIGNFPHMFLVLCIWIFQISVESAIGSLSYENKDYVKIKQDPTRFQQASAYVNKDKYISRRLNTTTSRDTNNIVTKASISRKAPRNIGIDYNNEQNNVANNTVTKSSPYKKWQVGRVSRKQYEIINMLWRKTKIFVNVDQTTSNYYPKRDNDTKKVADKLPALRQPFLRTPTRMNMPSTTPSYIEFYYLDETDEHGKELTRQKYTPSSNKKGNQFRSLGNFRFVLADSPMFAFRIDDPNYKRSAMPTRFMLPTNRMRRRKTRTHDSSLTNFDSLNSLTPPYKFPRKEIQQSKLLSSTTVKIKPENIYEKFKGISQGYVISKDTTEHRYVSTTEYTFNNETCPMTTDTVTVDNNYMSESSAINITNNDTEPTTPYDKIKFFEIYDKHTQIPYYDDKGKLKDMENVEIHVKGNELNKESKILLEHVDQSIGNEHSNPHKAKHFKKRIIENYKGDSKGQNNDNSVVRKVVIKHVPINASMAKLLNISVQPIKRTTLPELVTAETKNYKSNIAKWSDYSFSATYVYEPSQVHCDAAGISPHWLITSGACLSRHHKNPGGDGRSAFVTYCGESWWNPERVAYVKTSLVHPRFHSRDKTRRHVYNIGLIQVVTSMASACNGWAPISLMSHQFIADAEGSIANAIGWGLDRFDTRYSSNDLPKSPLMSYESQVFSDSCPGNIGYSKAKRLEEEGGVRNVYCLSLPPYSGEEKDPIHGGLLLVGGKLVALYLQEERRPWGDQCAQYTGTWRLVPWVLDVARENEETDSFTLEM